MTEAIHDDLRAAIFRAGYLRCHITATGNAVTACASPARRDRTGKLRLGDVLRKRGVIPQDHTEYADTEIVTWSTP